MQRIPIKKVVRTFVHEKKEIVHIKVNGEEITTTDEHPFYVPEKGWTVAAELRAGDQLKLLNGEIVIIEQIQHELLENPIFVYNFEVEDFRTYYVSEFGILVHNSCDDEVLKTERAAIRAAKRSENIPLNMKATDIKDVWMVGADGKNYAATLEVYGNKFIRNDFAGHIFSDGSSLPGHFNAGKITGFRIDKFWGKNI